jgi:hypothetical protein
VWYFLFSMYYLIAQRINKPNTEASYRLTSM